MSGRTQVQTQLSFKPSTQSSNCQYISEHSHLASVWYSLFQHRVPQHQGPESNKLAAIPAWLAQRIDALDKAVVEDEDTGNRAPRYEASWYGPTNSILCVVFAPELSFIVKPQSRLRNSVPSNKPVKPRTSTDSYNEPVERNKSDPVPDFIVAKSAPSLHNDKHFLVLEVKRAEESQQDAASQLDIYTTWLRRHHRNRITEKQHVLLMVSSSVSFYEFEQTGPNNFPMVQCTGSAIKTNSSEFWEFLHDLRVEHGVRAETIPFPPFQTQPSHTAAGGSQ